MFMLMIYHRCCIIITLLSLTRSILADEVCQNNGILSNGVCECPPGFAGTYCEESVNICSLPQDVGPCKAYYPRWFYNSETQVCEKFVYGGCLGNQNNFQTDIDCYEKCVKDDSSSPCSHVDCSDNGVCVAQASYSKGYWCECNEGWAGQDCKYAEPSVTCGDRTIDVYIDKGLIVELGLSDKEENIYFGQSKASRSCSASAFGDHQYKLSVQAPFTNCGTNSIQKLAGDDYTFSNTVVWNARGNSSSMISREFTLLDFKCIYEDTYTVSGPGITPAKNILKMATSKGKFEVQLRLFDDASFTRETATESGAGLIPVGTYVWVQVELVHINDVNLVVTLDRCFASQTPDPADPISPKHVLLFERCANENDNTVQILYNGEQSKAQFKFQMFKWRWSADDIYIHCEVDICNRTQEYCMGEGTHCKGLGNISRRTRREIGGGGQELADDVPLMKMISAGPLRPAESDPYDQGAEAFTESTDNTVIILSVLTGIVLIAVGVVIGVYVRKRLQQKKKMMQTMMNKKHLTTLQIQTEQF